MLTSDDDRFLAAKSEWLDHHGNYRSVARQWLVAACVSLLPILVLCGGLVYLYVRPTVVPHVVTVDPHPVERIVAYNPASVPAAMSQQAARATAWRFIRLVRRVTPDTAVQAELLTEVDAMLMQKDPNYNIIRAELAEYAPFELAKNYTVSPQLTEMRTIARNTWHIRWTETWLSRIAPVEKSTKRHRANVSVRLGPVENDSRAMLNPLGIYISQFEWVARDE